MKKISLFFAAIIASSLLSIVSYSTPSNNETTIPSTTEESSADCMPLDDQPLNG